MRASDIAKLTFGVLAVVFLIAPLIAILPLAFTSSVFLTYPIPDYSLRWFHELFGADVWRMAIVNSLIVGTGTTILACVLGTMASLGLRNSGLVLPGLFRTAFLLPMVVPAVVLGVGMQVFFVQIGFANTYAGVICAHTVVAVPFVVVSVSASLAGIDRRVERAALSLGASPFTVFRRVTFPLALPGILSGAVFAFATSLDEVVLTLFVAGPNQRTLARQMFSTIRENISPAIAAAAFLFIVGTLLVALVALLIRRRSSQARQPA
ncbi:MAG: polyamine ABC transporter permease [Mesorhizobium sp. 61-13]|nr:MAG: polyamine ABC transporter permease [Mesorhizobium sp. 61-13]